jgi:hypothetical protein
MRPQRVVGAMRAPSVVLPSPLLTRQLLPPHHCRCFVMSVLQAPVPPPRWSSAVLGHTEGQLEGMEPKHISLLLLGLGGLKVGFRGLWQSWVE